MSRARYLLWALAKALNGGKGATECPSCGQPATVLLRRKYAITALRECPQCLLRFRTPKDDPASAERFYAAEIYKQGFTTDLPSNEKLQTMLENGFRGTEKDFSARIELLRAAGLQPGSRVLDFGSSWGYGSWQLRHAGFDVFGYEIGRERARYAKEKLGCSMVDDLRSLDGTIDCFFSSHVIEHLPNPNFLFDEGRKLLRIGGLWACYCPNGATEREHKHGSKAYDLNWGLVHPLMVSPGFMKKKISSLGFSGCCVFSSPVHTADVEARRDGCLEGEELLTIAYRNE